MEVHVLHCAPTLSDLIAMPSEHACIQEQSACTVHQQLQLAFAIYIFLQRVLG